MDFERIVFSGHAVQRMFERGLGKDDVVMVLREGDVIQDYPDDTPYRSCVMLGWARGHPVHVLAALDDASRTAVVVTAYEPDPALWSKDFRTRRNP